MAKINNQIVIYTAQHKLDKADMLTGIFRETCNFKAKGMVSGKLLKLI